MNDHTKTLERQAVWTPVSGARKPDAYLPHPPLQSGGWYRGAVEEAPGPGRPPVETAPRLSTRSVVVLTLLFGLFGFLARSLDNGVFALAGTMVALAAPVVLLRGRRRRADWNRARTRPAGRR